MPAPLIERQEPLDALERLARTCTAGAGTLALVEGPAGIGKTRLLRELIERCLESGEADVLEASASELERGYPLGVVLRLLERATQADDDATDSLFRGHASLAERVLRGQHEDSPSLNDEFALVHSLYWLVVNLADARPLVLVVDDIQWADEQSLRFLHYLTQRIHDLPVAVVLAVRTGDQAADGDTLTRLMLEASLTIQLTELTRDGTREFLTATLGVEEDLDALVEDAWTSTRGNPFLLREVTAATTQQGVRALPDSAPDGVTRSVNLRIQSLGRHAVALARAVSVLAGPVEVGAASSVAQMSIEDALVAADLLQSAQILDPEGGLSFHHPIIKSAVYARLNAQERIRLHRRAACLLHDLAAPDEEVALHLLRTAPFSEPWVSPILRAAGRSAGRKGAPATAAVFLRRALDQDDLSAVDRGETLIALGIMEAAAGETESLVHLERALLLLTEPEARSRGMYALGQTLFRYGRSAEALTVFRRGADDFAPSDRELALRFEAGYLASAAYLVDRPKDAVQRLEKLAPELEDAPALTPAERLILLHLAVYRAMSEPASPDHAALALAALGDGLQLWHETSDGMTLSHAVLGLTWAGAPSAAIGVADRVLEDARRRGDSLIFAEMSLARAMATYAKGDVRDAMADAQSAVIGMARGWNSTVPAPQGILAYCHLDRGETEEAAAVLEEAETGLREGPTATLNVWFYMARGRLRLVTGQYELALDDFMKVGDLLHRNGYTNPGYMLRPWRSQAALALNRLSRHAEAVDLVSQDVEDSERYQLPSTLGAALRTRAMLEDSPDPELLRRSAEVLQAQDASSLELAETLLELGSAERRAGTRVLSRDTLRRAHDLAHRQGALALEERAHQELLAAGARPRRAAIQGPDSLTPSEHRIADLMSQGHTSRQIAETLYLTMSTVEWHRRNIYRKLEISSRDELRAAMSGQPLDIES
ncbi:AAA family ATPase [Nocardioides sp. NPDC127514]|uniref:helix-turn-helix transcriptional regulator n=1 Tax=unclassified Nocardioides TaxID=2615069 RepID=UPI00332340A0